MIYEVYVYKDGNNWEQHRCDWLGHHSYRCGKCKKGYFKVTSETEHDEACPECKAKVTVRRSPIEW